MKKNIIILIGIVTVVCLCGLCVFLYNLYNGDKLGQKSRKHDQQEKLFIFTSIQPQEYFVEQIGGTRVKVQALVPPGSSPATYEPTPRQMADLSKAKIFFRIGVPFENAFLANITETTDNLHIVDTRKGIKLRIMQHHHGHENEHKSTDHSDHEQHNHATEAEHAHDDDDHNKEGNDPHIWLSPKLVKIQARTITDALIDKDPDGKTYYEHNLSVFMNKLDKLDQHLTDALAPVKGRSFMVFHPSWGYFADAYGLKQEPIEIEGKEPSGKQLVRIIEMAQTENIRVVFVQPQFNMNSAKRIADAINGVVIPIDPLSRDYITNLEKVAETVREALQEQK